MRKLCFILFFLFYSGITYSQGESCYDAIEIDLSEGSDKFYSILSSIYQDTIYCDQGHSMELWFSFIATHETLYSNIISNSDDEVNLSLFKGECPNLEVVNCSLGSYLTTIPDLEVGDQYFIRISSDDELYFQYGLIPDYWTPQYQIKNFSIPELSDHNTSSHLFLEDIDGSIWLFSRSDLGEDIFMKYTGEEWQNIPSPCSGCFRDAAVSQDGIIYLAGGSDGLYQYKNGVWTQLLTEDVGSVFVDAYGQLAVITDVGVGKVIDNQYVETNNDGFPGFQYRKKVITRENRIYLGANGYCYESGWTDIERRQLTLGAPFYYLPLQKDTNDLVHYAIRYYFPAPDYSSIGAFDNGTYIGADLLMNSFDFYAYVIDSNNAVWTLASDLLRKDDGESVIALPVTELFSGVEDDANSTLSLFVDSKANCWFFKWQTSEIAVLHDVSTELGVGYVADDNEVIEIDCKTFTFDIDGDGYASDVDCDDYKAWINPGANETPYNWVDDDCNPETLDNDLDQDGYLLAEECDDSDAAINPDAEEICDGLDNDCDGEIDEGLVSEDSDGDGICDAVDCLPNNSAVYPGNQELPYNGIDDDCDESTLDDDLDQDGFVVADDCDDSDAAIYQGAPCDDNNLCTINDVYTEDCFCVGDTFPKFNYFEDFDSDGFGDAGSTIELCTEGVPNGYVDNDLDCDDTNSLINPDAEDIPNNGIDEDCDGQDALSSTHELDGEKIEIYPNPVSDILQVNATIGRAIDLHFYDLSGRLIIQSIDTNTINCAHLESGMYLLKVIDDQSGDFVVERIVVTR